MDGTLFLEGYKLKHRITLNLQKHTILLSHADMFTPTILFDMIERYFNKQNFSDTYQKSVHIRLNEKKLSPTDFQVWRIRPDVNVEEELKIAKKTLLGQYLEQLYRDKQNVFERIGHSVEKELLNELNVMLKRYDMRLECDEQNIYTFAKMLSLGTYMAEEEVLPSEYSQYQAKQFLLDVIDDIEAQKPKLLLVELPEYGLDHEELRSWYTSLMNKQQIPISIIYTQSKEILRHVEDIYAYHLCRDYRVLGFDDYDEMEEMLLDHDCWKHSPEEIKQKFMNDLFDEQTYQQKYEKIDTIFRK